MSKLKIEIKSRWNNGVLFEYEKDNNTIKETLEKAVEEGADLKGAYLYGADLEGAYLYGAYLYGANLEGAYLQGACLEGADLKGAYLKTSDNEIDTKEVIKNLEENSNIRIKKTYINHDILPRRWNCMWKNGLIIRQWEIVENKTETKKMTVAEICNELGYEVEIIKGEE